MVSTTQFVCLKVARCSTRARGDLGSGWWFRQLYVYKYCARSPSTRCCF